MFELPAGALIRLVFLSSARCGRRRLVLVFIISWRHYHGDRRNRSIKARRVSPVGGDVCSRRSSIRWISVGDFFYVGGCYSLGVGSELSEISCGSRLSSQQLFSIVVKWYGVWLVTDRYRVLDGSFRILYIVMGLELNSNRTEQLHSV